MPFYKRLDQLMNFQGVSNSRLAKNLSVDASLVSRWRSGKRLPSARGNYIEAIAAYFASQARHEYQKQALFELMGIPYAPGYQKQTFTADCLLSWLLDNPSYERGFVDGFIQKINAPVPPAPLLEISKDTISKLSGIPIKTEVFYGLEGKRESVLYFLSLVAAQEKPCTLLLYSDESMNWLAQERQYFKKWEAVLNNILSKGHHIKIIHTVARDISELLLAVERWFPLYMSGRIEPYYYPKYREPVFRRTMFIAPGVAALTCVALPEHSGNAAQFIHTDQAYIANLAAEFNSYLGLCRPLMHIFTNETLHKLPQIQLDFEQRNGESISFSDMLSSVTVPEALFLRMIERGEAKEKQRESLVSLYAARTTAFERYISGNRYTEFVTLPDLKGHTDSLPLPKGYFGPKKPQYTREDFKEHLEHVIRLMEKYKNYRVIPIKKSIPDGIFLYAKEKAGAIVGKSDTSLVVFAFNHPKMTDAFFSYLKERQNQVMQENHPSGGLKSFLST